MPTIEQIYNSSESFIKLYEDSGLENARPKIRALLYKYIEYLNINSALKKNERDTLSLQRRAHLSAKTQSYMATQGRGRAMSSKFSRRAIIKKNKVSTSKKLARLKKVRIRYIALLCNLPDFEAKIKQFPTIEYEPSDLIYKHPTNLLLKSAHKRMMLALRYLSK